MLAAGQRLIRLRCADPSVRLPPSLLRVLAADAADAGARVVVDIDDRLDGGPPHGIHLRAADLHRFGHRPVEPERLLLASCHDAADLARAECLGVDVVLISPVRATTSHPDRAAIGWPGFRALRERTRLPAYALGGLTVADLGDARRHGAIGIAGIGGFLPLGAAAVGKHA
jgi:8-oxo-dGTP diphosphatase